MPSTDRLKGLTDQRKRVGRQLVVLERGVIFGLEIILAALDLLDDFLVAALGDGIAHIDPAAMEIGLERAVVIGFAAELADLLLKPAHDLAALLGELAEHLDEIG